MTNEDKYRYLKIYTEVLQAHDLPCEFVEPKIFFDKLEADENNPCKDEFILYSYWNDIIK